MKLRSGISGCLALLLAVALVGSGCSWGGTGEGSRLAEAPSSSAVEAAAQPTAAPSPTLAPTPTPQPSPVTVEGTITAAATDWFNLLLPDGTLFTVLFSQAGQGQVENCVNGNLARVTYDETARQGDTVTAWEVQISVPEQYAGVEERLSSMTLEEKVGQLFFVRVPAEGADADVAQYHFGGYILFGRDFKGQTREQVQQTLQSYQASSKIPLLLGVDEEGGTVVRVSANPNLCEEPYYSPRALYDMGGLDVVAAVEQDKIATLQGLGLNVNFAPVCDISQQEGAFMYGRSLGRDAETTSEYIRKMVGLYSQNSMGCVLKHFPGYGNNADTHTGMAIDERPYETFRQQDFQPFQAGIQAGAGCVLVSHNIVTCVDGQYPASLSSQWHQVLREELGFTGCVITDDLVMDAIRQYCDASSAAVQAVKAGNDLLCCSDYETQDPAVLAAVQNGEISEERIDESVRRALRWKAQLGILG